MGETESTAVLVIRAWLDEDGTEVRARLIESTTTGPVNETLVVGDEDVLLTVARWLSALRSVDV